MLQTAGEARAAATVMLMQVRLCHLLLQGQALRQRLLQRHRLLPRHCMCPDRSLARDRDATCTTQVGDGRRSVDARRLVDLPLLCPSHSGLHRHNGTAQEACKHIATWLMPRSTRVLLEECGRRRVYFAIRKSRQHLLGPLWAAQACTGKQQAAGSAGSRGLPEQFCVT